jgi:hypothetical protein
MFPFLYSNKKDTPVTVMSSLLVMHPMSAVFAKVNKKAPEGAFLVDFMLSLCRSHNLAG